MTTSHWFKKKTSASADISTDILIVGGGYIGLSTAYWLSLFKPDLKITILERRFCGAGASGRNAGFLTKGSISFYQSLAQDWGEEKAKKLYNFAGESLSLAHEHILKKCQQSFEASSSCTLIRSTEQKSHLLKGGFSADRFNFTWTEKEDLPSALQQNFIGAYENGPEYKVNPVEILSTLKQILISRGVKLIEGEMAFEVCEDGVRTESQLFKCKQVILALNSYFPQFSTSFKDIITPRRAQMLAVEIEEGFDCPSLYYDSPERVYWRKAGERVLLIGGKRLLDEKGEVGDYEKLSPKIQNGLEEYVSQQLGLKYKVINRWSGIMGFTEHELPLVGRVSAPIETYVIGGFSGHGMGLGFHSGKDMAEVVAGLKKESFYHQFRPVNLSL